MIEDKSKLSESEINEIKLIFKDLVEKGERYDMDEIEFWFEMKVIGKQGKQE